MMNIDHVRSRFIKHLNGKIGNIYLSPGCINLTDEHTDYDSGPVFPDAVDKGIMAEAHPNGTSTIMCYAIDMKDRVEFKVDDPEGPRTSWARYIYGMAQGMKRPGVDVKGFNTIFSGDVPFGASTSSPIALGSCFAFALNDSFGDNGASKWDMALAGQATGYKYVGVSYGIMDQLASIFGQEGKFMRLDYRSHEFEYLPFNPEDYRLMLVSSCVKHKSVGLPYNDRRKSCENAAEHITAEYPNEKFEALHDCTWEQLKAVKTKVGEEDCNHAHFILGGKDHILATYDASEADGYETMSKKMYETHEGLSKDYEAFCGELDFLNDVAKENGVTGGRITGGGSGSCTINLVKDEIHDKFVANATKKYPAKLDKKPEIYDIVISRGFYKVC